MGWLGKSARGGGPQDGADPDATIPTQGTTSAHGGSEGNGAQQAHGAEGATASLLTRTSPQSRRRPVLAAVAALVVLFATGCVVLAMTVGPTPFAGLGLGFLGGSSATATTQPSPTSTQPGASPSATATLPGIPTPVITPSPIKDGPSYTGAPIAQPSFPGASPSLRDCPGGAPNPPYWPIRGIGGNNYATAHKEIALTFDDGPSNANDDTPQLLSWLVQHHVAATFFVVGVRVAADPAALRQEYADGFDIGVHTWDHSDMTRLSPAGMQQELGSTLALIHQVLGPGSCVWFWRPPYGSYNSTVMSAAQSFGLTSIMWDMDPADWSSPGTGTIIARVEAQAHPGGILLEHDGPGGRWETLAAVQSYVPYLEAQGYHFVTVSQLLADSGLPPAGAPPTPTKQPSPTATATTTPTPTDTPTPTPTDTPTGSPSPGTGDVNGSFQANAIVLAGPPSGSASTANTASKVRPLSEADVPFGTISTWCA